MGGLEDTQARIRQLEFFGHLSSENCLLRSCLEILVCLACYFASSNHSDFGIAAL
jgi:hypothetical protein